MRLAPANGDALLVDIDTGQHFLAFDIDGGRRLLHPASFGMVPVAPLQDVMLKIMQETGWRPKEDDNETSA